MAYQMKVDGMAEISELLSQMQDKAPAVAAKALYDGAGIMAKEVSSAVDTIKTEDFHYAVFPPAVQRMPTPEEKEIVRQAAVGIAKFDKNGTEVDTIVGFRQSGYAELNGKQKPIPVIVNAINSGTSFMKKQPFIRKAANNGAPKAMKAMKERIESEFEAMKK